MYKILPIGFLRDLSVLYAPIFVHNFTRPTSTKYAELGVSVKSSMAGNSMAF
jgi:hypothetical protein